MAAHSCDRAPPDFVRLTLPGAAFERVLELVDDVDRSHWDWHPVELLCHAILWHGVLVSTVLINSAPGGWWVVDQRSGRLFAEPEQALALCRQLASGNARDRDIAARIREQSARSGVDNPQTPQEADRPATHERHQPHPRPGCTIVAPPQAARGAPRRGPHPLAPERHTPLLTAASSYVTDALHLSADPEHRANVRKLLHEIGKAISPTLTALPNDGE